MWDHGLYALPQRSAINGWGWFVGQFLSELAIPAANFSLLLGLPLFTKEPSQLLKTLLDLFAIHAGSGDFSWDTIVAIKSHWTQFIE